MVVIKTKIQTWAMTTMTMMMFMVLAAMAAIGMGFGCRMSHGACVVISFPTIACRSLCPLAPKDLNP